MGKRSKKSNRAVNGWLAVDKPSGMGSTDVVNRLKRLLDAPKVGHGGTLDPMATGVLPIAFGEATKTMNYALNGNKSYLATVQWGTSTTSLDADGQIEQSGGLIPDANQIEAALPAFIGEISQVPPKVSALKVDGKRAHQLVREGEEFELEPRQTKIFELRLESHDPVAGRSEIFVSAAKGFYVRALARDLATSLGTLAHLVALRRVRSGPFGVEQCISLEKLEAMDHISDREALLLPLKRALDDIPALELGEAAARQLRNGQSVWVLRRSLLDQIDAKLPGFLSSQSEPVSVLVTAEGAEVGLAEFARGRVSPKRLFNI